MITIEEAKSLISKHIPILKEEVLHTTDSLGFVLSQNVLSPIHLPSFNRSAMDGYAVCFSAQPTIEFKLAAEVKTGDFNNTELKQGECVRIFTGAMIPNGASAVVMQEKVTAKGKRIKLDKLPASGENIRTIGEQIKKDDLALSKGTLINAAGIGFLSALGITKIKAYKKPTISIVVTGNELSRPTEKLEQGKIYESNSQMLSSALKTSGYKASKIAWVKDDLDSTIKELELASKDSDIVLISGGISVGDYDYVETALEKIGVKKLFYKVNQKPGKPLFFGKKDKTLFFGLPGNPSASLVCYYQYVLFAIKKMSGVSDGELEKRELISRNNFTKKGIRPQFLKAKANQNEVHLLEGQSSAMLHTFSLANALVYLPGHEQEIKVGDKLITYILPSI